MRRFLKDEEVLKRILVITLSGVLITVFYFFLHDFATVRSAVHRLFGVLSPFIWGIGLAFLLTYPMNYFKRHLPFSWSEKTRHNLGVTFSFLIFLAIIILFMVILIPQLFASVNQLYTLISENMDTIIHYFENIGEELNLSDTFTDAVESFFRNLVSTGLAFFRDRVPAIWNATITGVRGIGNFIIGMIVALYILLDLDNMKRRIKKFFLAVLNEKSYRNLRTLIDLTANKFGGFIVGKIIDSVIIGIICFILMNILQLEYSVLISFVIGITNIIPFFGPFIGAVPSAFILLFVNPWHSLWFLIMILILQQVDGNIIGPRILGESVGLSNIWIMFSIIVGGAYFGVVGMVLSVPVFAVIYLLLDRYIEQRLIKKGIPLN